MGERPAGPRRAARWERRHLFAVLTPLVPLVFLALLEGGLRLAGFGHSYPLFVACPEKPGFLCPNRQAVRRFMVDEERAPKLRILPVPFRREKPADGFRIFVQGGSTAQGYPYGVGASVTGMLQQRLERTFPLRTIETVSTAMSAVNSYTLLDFSGEILEQQPDAILVYAGHNEYVGILGVGSEFSVGRRRPVVLSFLAVKELRIFQLLKGALSGLRREEEEREEIRRTLMATIAAERHIPYGSPLYRRGLEQFRANLRALLGRYRHAGVPVFIGTVVSNERDRPPFLSGHGQGVDTRSWQRHLDAGRLALESGEPGVALRELSEAVAIDDAHAEGHFQRARALEALGQHGEARTAYLAAKDRDELRFRAPEEINAIIREVAAAQGAHLVDVQQAFVSAGRDGIVGRELLLEHVHPNVDGYFVLADAFYEALHEQDMIGSWTHRVPRELARREIPLLERDRRRGERRVRRLTSDWPFSNERELAAASLARDR